MADGQCFTDPQGVSGGEETQEFAEDSSEGAPICRWKQETTILDVMPLDEQILGFSNRWYRAALESAERRDLPEDVRILLVNPVYFCATKLEAFRGRGNDDYLASHDLEDFMAVIDGRPEFIDEIQNASADVRAYLGL